MQSAAFTVTLPLRRLAFAACLLLATGMANAATPVAGNDVREIQRLQRSGDTAGALQRLERAIADRPRDAQLRFLKGVILADQRREAEAMGVFQALNEEFPELPEPYNNLAVLHAAQGRIDTARELLEAALRQDPNYRAAHENLGDVFVRLAARSYERAVDPARADDALARKLQLARQLGSTR